MVKKYARFFVVSLMVSSLTFIASGCAQKKVMTDQGTDTMQAEPVQQQQPKPEPVVSEPVGMEESLDTPAQPEPMGMTILEGRTTGPMLPVYFDFDKSNIRMDQKSRIEGNARYLKGNMSAKVVIEGNCDERGTNEYNMALGERRAQSAKKYLVNLGVAENRLSTISYGEERPLNHGHDELAWSQNRRDDFVEVR